MKTKTYTEDEIEKRVRDHLDTYTVHEMVEYIVEDLFRYCLLYTSDAADE